jgi:hypothetical protein
MVTNAHFPVRQAIDSEVLAELSVGEIVAAKLALPIAIGVNLVNQNGTVLAAVPNQVSLPIPINIKPADYPSALNWSFPDGGVDGLPLPGDILREAHVYIKQARRHFLPLRRWLPTIA